MYLIKISMLLILNIFFLGLQINVRLSLITNNSNNLIFIIIKGSIIYCVKRIYY